MIQQYQAYFDLIFLEIEMRFLDGMTTAKLIRETDPDAVFLREQLQQVSDRH